MGSGLFAGYKKNTNVTEKTKIVFGKECGLFTGCNSSKFECIHLFNNYKPDVMKLQLYLGLPMLSINSNLCVMNYAIL